MATTLQSTYCRSAQESSRSCTDTAMWCAALLYCMIPVHSLRFYCIGMFFQVIKTKLRTVAFRKDIRPGTRYFNEKMKFSCGSHHDQSRHNHNTTQEQHTRYRLSIEQPISIRSIPTTHQPTMAIANSQPTSYTVSYNSENHWSVITQSTGSQWPKVRPVHPFASAFVRPRS